MQKTAADPRLCGFNGTPLQGQERIAASMAGPSTSRRRAAKGHDDNRGRQLPYRPITQPKNDVHTYHTDEKTVQDVIRKKMKREHMYSGRSEPWAANCPSIEGQVVRLPKRNASDLLERKDATPSILLQCHSNPSAARRPARPCLRSIHGLENAEGMKLRREGSRVRLTTVR